MFLQLTITKSNLFSPAKTPKCKALLSYDMWDPYVRKKERIRKKKTGKKKLFSFFPFIPSFFYPLRHLSLILLSSSASLDSTVTRIGIRPQPTPNKLAGEINIGEALIVSLSGAHQ